MHHQHAILVAEDEPFIALDLVLAIEDAGGTAVGPASRVREALDLLAGNPVAGAILDVNLIDGEITPVVEYLVAAGIPFILQTGIGLPPALATQFPDLPVRIKPNASARLVAELEALMAGPNPPDASASVNPANSGP